MAQAPDMQVMALPLVAANRGVTEVAFGGGLEGAERTNRETALWSPSMGSPDQLINSVKPMADARGRDLAVNDGMSHGAIATNKDAIVGSHYRLNASPAIRVLKTTGYAFDETWSEEAQSVIEARFELLAESDSHWLDASRSMTLTEMIRLGLGGFTMGGEVCASGEWLNRDRARPLNTAVQLFSGTRLSNPNGESDTATMKRGVVKDLRGKVLGYWIRAAHPSELYDRNSYKWNFVAAEKPWGRPQILHVLERMEVGQSRGVADIVATLLDTRMGKVFKQTSLQNAVVNASYAASLEADLPPEAVYGMMGQNTGAGNFASALGSYISILNSYFSGANNIAIDGAKVPVLPPGVKLNAKNLGTPGGVGSDFEEGLHRHISAALGMSYEEYANNWKGVSYSGGKMAVAKTNRFMKSRKRLVADRIANFVYGLVLEEEINAGNVPLPVGCPTDIFYEPLMREAFSRATWIGAGAGQIDEMKETQAAVMRVKAGFSTYEKEIARFGDDWREVFAQRAREEGVIAKTPALKRLLSLDATKPGAKASQNQMADDPKKKKAKAQ